MKYKIFRTDVADSQIRSIILYIAEKFGKEIALQKLDDLEKGILALADNPELGTEPRYPVLKRQGYKVNETRKEIILYAVVDQRQDYLSIIRGL